MSRNDKSYQGPAASHAFGSGYLRNVKRMGLAPARVVMKAISIHSLTAVLALAVAAPLGW